MNVACFLFSFLWRLWDEAHTKYKPEPERLLAWFCRHFQISSHSMAEFWKSSSSQKCCHMLWLHIISNLESESSSLHTDGLRSIHQPIPLCPRQWKGTISEKQSQLFEKPWLCDSSKTQSEIQDQICLFILLDMSSKQHSFSKTTLVRSPPGVMFWLTELGSAWRLGLQGVPPRHLRCTPLMMTREQTWDRKLWCSPAKCRGEKSSGRIHPYNLIRIISKYVIIVIYNTHTCIYIVNINIYKNAKLNIPPNSGSLKSINPERNQGFWWDNLRTRRTNH